MSKIKSCPFCGKELIINKGYYAHELSLTEPIECYAATWVFRVDDEKSIELWNTRKPMNEAYENGYTDAELQCEKVFDEKIDKILKQLEKEKDINNLNYNISLYKDYPEIKQRYECVCGAINNAIKIVKECAE